MGTISILRGLARNHSALLAGIYKFQRMPFIVHSLSLMYIFQLSGRGGKTE